MRAPTVVRVAAVASGVVLAAACLLKESSHTLYLEPDGALVWTVLERDVRSDEQGAESRAAEEKAYLEAALKGEHAMARALARLGAEEVDSTVLRAQRPFAVWTSARFSAAADAARQLLAWAEVDGKVRRWQEDGVQHLEVRLVIPEEDEEAGEQEIPDDELLWELADELEDYRIVLTSGHFVEATNFTIDGDLAVPVEPDEEKARAAGGEVVFALAWIP